MSPLPPGEGGAERRVREPPGPSGGHSGRTGGYLVLGLLLAIAYAGWRFYASGMQFEFRVRIANARGLAIGSPVRIAGVKAGRVRSISFGDAASDPGRLLPILTLSVDRRMANAIRTDLTAEIDRALVFGESAVEITPGTGMGKPLAEGDLVDLAPYRAQKGMLDSAQEGLRSLFAPDQPPPPSISARPEPRPSGAPPPQQVSP